MTDAKPSLEPCLMAELIRQRQAGGLTNLYDADFHSVHISGILNLTELAAAMRRAPSAEGRLIEDWRKLANISKGCLENAEQEIDQLKTLIREVSAAILAMKDAEGYAKSGDNKTWSAAINRLYSTHRSLDAALRGEP